MQWHEDTFDLPAGAVPLLTGTACRNQAFRVADAVWGFQCHFEADRRDMVSGRNTVATSTATRTWWRGWRSRQRTHGEAAEAFGRQVADRWLDLVMARMSA